MGSDQRQRQGANPATNRITPSENADSGRRSFLQQVAAAVGGAVAAVLTLVPAARGFLSPLGRKATEREWVRLGDPALFDPGVPVRIDFPETVSDAWLVSRELRSVWALTEDGEQFTVFSGVCTHLGCAFRFDREADEYHSQANVFHCPCHHAVFDGKTGAVLDGPAPRQLDRLEAKVEDGLLFAKYRRFRAGTPDQVEI